VGHHRGRWATVAAGAGPIAAGARPHRGWRGAPSRPARRTITAGAGHHHGRRGAPSPPARTTIAAGPAHHHGRRGARVSYPAAMHPTRRELLRLAAASTMSRLIACGDNEPVVAASAVLDPAEDSAVVAIWSRLAGRPAEVEVRAAGRPPIRTSVTLDGEIGRLVVTGLAPDTAYEITVTVAGLALGTHRVRTAPGAGARRPVRLAVTADCDPNPAFASGMIDAVAAAAPDLVISIGDFPYTDNGPPAHTVAEYRARHVELRTHPPVRTLLAAAGM
jgi:hypothetical protein